VNDQKEVNLALRVAIEAVKAHTECDPLTCGGFGLDRCALGSALDELTSYQRSAGYIVAPHIWVLRTWADVRRGDVVRMPGQEATAAEVMELTTLSWHVNDIPPEGMTPEEAERFARDVQYRPNEHAGEWTARSVTLRPLSADDPAARHRIPNVNPAAPVEIRLTQAEVDAIELLGGWAQRVQ